MVMDGQKSDWKPVTSGIPQGSVHRPLVLVILMDDLLDFAADILCGLYKGFKETTR